MLSLLHVNLIEKSLVTSALNLDLRISRVLLEVLCLYLIPNSMVQKLMSEMSVGLAGICCNGRNKCSLTHYQRHRLLQAGTFSACPNDWSKFSWNMKSCIQIPVSKVHNTCTKDCI